MNLFPIIPKSGPVYQPTTMPYRTRPGTGAAGGLLAQTTAASSMKMLRKLAAQMSVLIFDLISLAAGVAMIAVDHQTIQTPSSTHQHSRRRIGHRSLRFLDSSYFIKVADWRRHCVCPCILYKNQGLSRQLQGNSGGQILVLNHYTDPLLSHTKYAPVSEMEDEERRNLMCQIAMCHVSNCRNATHALCFCCGLPGIMNHMPKIMSRTSVLINNIKK